MPRRGFAGLLWFGAAACHAAWAPQWVATWDPEAETHVFEVLRVHPGGDGSVVVGAGYRDAAPWHVALVRIDADGQVVSATVGDRELFRIGPSAALANQRIAMLGADEEGLRVEVHERRDGAFAWSGVGAGMSFQHDERQTRPLIAQAPDGDVLAAASDGGDFVVARFDREGTPLPPWRAPCAQGENASVDAIVALADGGAAVVGRCAFGDGYRTVAFDPDGVVRIDEYEPGAIGGPIGPGAIGVDGEGALLVAGDPESVNGVPLAQVWKFAPDGSREWLRVLPFDGDGLPSLALGGFSLAADGDVVVVADPVVDPFHVMRLAAADGTVRRNRVTVRDGTPSRVALAPNGRTLVAAIEFVGGGGQVEGRLIEFAPDGSPCRHYDATGYLRRFEIAADAHGWIAAGEGSRASGNGNALVVQRFDMDGACTDGGIADRVFADGFDAAP